MSQRTHTCNGKWLHNMTSYNEKNTSTFRQRDNINLSIMTAMVCLKDDSSGEVSIWMIQFKPSCVRIKFAVTASIHREIRKSFLLYKTSCIRLPFLCTHRAIISQMCCKASCDFRISDSLSFISIFQIKFTWNCFLISSKFLMLCSLIVLVNLRQITSTRMWNGM